MGEDSTGLRHETPLDARLPTEWDSPIRSFIERLEHMYAVRCVVLHGSFATGNWIRGSDVDLVVIADGLSASFRARLEAIADLRPRGVPLEVLPYTPAEFSEMLDTMHVTALEATSRGIALAGEDYFDRLKAHFDDMTRRGLRRGKSSWYWEKQGFE